MGIKVVRQNSEGNDDLLKRFKRSVERAGIITEVNDRSRFDKQANRKKRQRNQRKG